MRCNQCELLVINGVVCHEHGCPNTHKIYNREDDCWEEVEEDEDEEFYEEEDKEEQ